MVFVAALHLTISDTQSASVIDELPREIANTWLAAIPYARATNATDCAPDALTGPLPYNDVLPNRSLSRAYGVIASRHRYPAPLSCPK